MNQKDKLRALCYRLRARHGSALDAEYICRLKAVTTRPPERTGWRWSPYKANPNSRCPSCDFLILILDEIQVISW